MMKLNQNYKFQANKNLILSQEVQNKILILGDLDISTTKSMLNLLEAKASLFKECIMMFKPHPANHVNIKDYPKLNLSHKELKQIDPRKWK